MDDTTLHERNNIVRGITSLRRDISFRRTEMENISQEIQNLEQALNEQEKRLENLVSGRIISTSNGYKENLAYKETGHSGNIR